MPFSFVSHAPYNLKIGLKPVLSALTYRVWPRQLGDNRTVVLYWTCPVSLSMLRILLFNSESRPLHRDAAPAFCFLGHTQHALKLSAGALTMDRRQLPFTVQRLQATVRIDQRIAQGATLP